MKISIGKKFEFEACHKLPDEEIYGDCSNLHGHRYQLEVEVIGEIDKYGWICNYKDLKAIVKECIIDKYDHSYLNDFFEVPTAENMSVYIANVINEKLKEAPYKLHKVVLYETSTSYTEIHMND